MTDERYGRQQVALSIVDAERVRTIAEHFGLSNGLYIRMCVLKCLPADEAEMRKNEDVRKTTAG